MGLGTLWRAPPFPEQIKKFFGIVTFYRTFFGGFVRWQVPKLTNIVIGKKGLAENLGQK